MGDTVIQFQEKVGDLQSFLVDYIKGLVLGILNDLDYKKIMSVLLKAGVAGAIAATDALSAAVLNGEITLGGLTDTVKPLVLNGLTSLKAWLLTIKV